MSNSIILIQIFEEYSSSVIINKDDRSMPLWFFLFSIVLLVDIGRTARNGDRLCNIQFYVYNAHDIGHTRFAVAENGKNEDGSYMFGDMYATEMVAIEAFQDSPCRTEIFLSADFFVVPVAPLRSGGMGWSSDGNVYMDFDGIHKMFDQTQTIIETKFPNLWKSKAHVFFVSHDYSACLAPQRLGQQNIVFSPNGDYFSSPLK